MTFDSSVWSPASGTWVPVVNWGWSGSSDGLTGRMGFKSTGASCTDLTHHRYSYTVHTWGPYTDTFGVTHQIFAQQSDGEVPCDPGIFNSEYATDGSGLEVVPGGFVITPSGQTVEPPISGSGTKTDANGNQITVSGGIFTDTLGMNVLTVSGAAPNPIVFTYHDSTNTPRTVTVNYSTYTVKTNFGCVGVTDYGPTSNPLVSSIVYPDGSSYSFTYEPTPGFAGDVTGRIQSVTLPTGATITYNYTGGNNGIICADGSTAGLSRATTDGTSSYSRSGSGTAWTTTFNDATPGTPNKTTISFQTSSNNFYETQRIVYQGSGPTVLSQIDTCYNGGVPPCTSAALTLPFSSIDKYLTLGNQQSRTTTIFSTLLGLPTRFNEYDFGVNTPGPLLRSTIIAYAALGNNIADHPASIIVQDGSGNQKAKTTFAYDETAAITTTSVPMHTAITGSRGNLTTQSQWLDTTGANLSTIFTYDDTGNVLTSTDPGGHQTTFSYADNFSDGINRNSNAYLTKVTQPATSSPNAASHISSTQYEPNTGLASMTTDQNGQQTTFTYDLMLRPLLTNFPDGGQTSVSYPSPTETDVQKKIDASRSTFSATLLDSYGRVRRTAVANAEATPYDVTDVCYDSNGRTKFQSYPYQASSYTGVQVCSGAGDSFAYDGAGRTTMVTHSDSSTVQVSYSGRAAQITDEGNGSFNVSRIQQSDGLGRLTAICEVTSVSLLGNGGTPTSCGLDIAATGFLTTYGYNTLGNLTSVTQGSLVNRIFAFDSLSRMTSESEPEWGSGSTMSYTYNNDGLLTVRTRPAPNQTNSAVTVATNYGYDELDRLRTRTYTGDPSGTPSATFNYDESTAWSKSLSNTIGRLSSESAGSTTGQIFGYDSMGRPVINWQCTPRVCGTTAYLLSYGYDLAGDLISAGNGTGVTFTYLYNSAARLTGMTSSFVDSQHPATLLSNVHYNQFGAVGDTLGNGLNETVGYSTRGIPQSYSSTPYSFSLGLAANGSVTSGNDSVNGNWTYSYDNFNRLAGSNKNSSAQTFSYVYDRYGNRLQQNAPQGGPAPQYLFDSNNRIIGSGVTYDALGNVLTDGLGNTYTYDAESRLIKVVNSVGTYNYTYNAEGQRVKTNAAEYLYDLSGRAITLFDPTSGVWNFGEIYAGGRHVATYSGSTTNFLHTDWLGTKRVMSSISGANSQTCTSLPFGDGASCTGTEWGFNHFTDDIHDSESNLEHTWFRQLSGTQGRWTSPDPYLGSMNFSNPQSLNRYNYVFGAPTMQVDPLGLETSYFLVGDCLYSYNLVSNKAEDGEFEVTGPPTLVFCAGGGSSGGSGGGGGGGGKRMTIAQCRAANTLLEREEKSGTTAAAWQSAIGFGDGTVEPFNSSTPGNAYTETAVGSVKVDWFTDLRTTGLIPGPQIPAYIIGKLVWTGVRLATGAPITNSLPFQDPIESRTMALAAGGYGFRNLFTPEFMKENCGTF
ncbi:MAG TPA: RHS repeat-associated core domain-containing protein [Candidatus Angelobacter sp.]|nr:RHS repeat-associated core domain-containing protein [Candidatus Angelobacter sp.]